MLLGCEFVNSNGVDNRFLGTKDEAAEVLESILLETIDLQKEADVPLGSFLSGGVDSSLITALMQKTQRHQ